MAAMVIMMVTLMLIMRKILESTHRRAIGTIGSIIIFFVQVDNTFVKAGMLTFLCICPKT